MNLSHFSGLYESEDANEPALERLRNKLFISTGAVGQLWRLLIFPSRFSTIALLSAAVLRGAFLGVPELEGCRGRRRQRRTLRERGLTHLAPATQRGRGLPRSERPSPPPPFSGAAGG